MAIVTKKNGIFSGKVGETVSYMLNGQLIVRSLPDKVKRKPSKLALLNQARMRVCSEFLRPLKYVLKFGYQNVAPPGSRIGPFQAAQSYVFKNALAYNNDNMPFVNPEKVLIFRGLLNPPENVTVTRAGKLLNLTWAANGDAMLVVVAYNDKGKPGVVFSNLAVPGNAEVYSLDVKTDAPIHVYVGFYELYDNQLSDSVYVGKV